MGSDAKGFNEVHLVGQVTRVSKGETRDGKPMCHFDVKIGDRTTVPVGAFEGLASDKAIADGAQVEVFGHLNSYFKEGRTVIAVNADSVKGL